LALKVKEAGTPGLTERNPYNRQNRGGRRMKREEHEKNDEKKEEKDRKEEEEKDHLHWGKRTNGTGGRERERR
jgi:hypothetical protein